MYYLSESQIQQIRDARDNLNSLHRYADAYALIHQFIQQPDAFGNAADANVVAWFGAASQANLGEGGASELIRRYTAAQIEIRTGDAVGLNSAIMQLASDTIAENVISDLTNGDPASPGNRRVEINGQTYYTLITAFEIGQNDAQGAIDALEQSGYQFERAVWSGNPLFLGLGHSDFWQSNIIGTPGETYDLFVTLQALHQASVGVATAPQNIADLLDLFWSQGEAGRAVAYQQIEQASDLTQNFLEDAYGLAFGNLLNFASYGFVNGTVEVDGNLQSETLAFTDLFVHAGEGDDWIDGSLGRDLIDGGEGYDDINFFVVSQGYPGFSFALNLFAISSLAEFTGQITVVGDDPAEAWLENTTYLYSIEDVSLGAADDMVRISGTPIMNGPLSEVNGSSHGAWGDTIDLSAASVSTSSINLATGDVEFNGSSPGWTVDSFENVIGSVGSDTILGNDENNIIMGKDGADQMEGAGGDDVLVFDADDSIVQGGEGFDTGIFQGPGALSDFDMNAHGLEMLVASSQADTIIFGPSDEARYVAGGAGNDVFRVDTTGAGPVVIFGGSGTDEVVITQGPARILALNVVGLTEANFRQFDLSCINGYTSALNEEIDLIILNPDASDEFRFEYTDEYGTYSNPIGFNRTNTPVLSDLLADTLAYAQAWLEYQYEGGDEPIRPGEEESVFADGFYQPVGFLGGLTNRVFSGYTFVVEIDSELQMTSPGAQAPDWAGNPGLFGRVHATWYGGEDGSAGAVAEIYEDYWMNFSRDGQLSTSLAGLPDLDTWDGWEWLPFVAGGYFEDSSLHADNTITADFQPAPEPDWFLAA